MYTDDETPYNVYHNSPLYFIDPNGLAPEPKQYRTAVGELLADIKDFFTGRLTSGRHIKHQGDRQSNGSFLKRILQPIANAIRNIFTGGIHNRNTIPVRKWRKSNWIELSPEEGFE